MFQQKHNPILVERLEAGLRHFCGEGLRNYNREFLKLLLAQDPKKELPLDDIIKHGRSYGDYSQEGLGLVIEYVAIQLGDNVGKLLDRLEREFDPMQSERHRRFIYGRTLVTALFRIVSKMPVKPISSKGPDSLDITERFAQILATIITCPAEHLSAANHEQGDLGKTIDSFDDGRISEAISSWLREPKHFLLNQRPTMLLRTLEAINDRRPDGWQDSNISPLGRCILDHLCFKMFSKVSTLGKTIGIRQILKSPHLRLVV